MIINVINLRNFDCSEKYSYKDCIILVKILNLRYHCSEKNYEVIACL